MNTTKKIQEELTELSPLLAARKKENPYRVPKDYFVQLEEEVISQIQPSGVADSVGTKNIFDPLVEFVRQVFAARHGWQLAGLTAMLLGVAVFIFNQNNLASSTDIMASVDEEEVNNYIINHIDEFDVDFLTDYMLEEEIDVDEVQLDLNDEEMDELLDEILDEMEFDEMNGIEDLL